MTWPVVILYPESGAAPCCTLPAALQAAHPIQLPPSGFQDSVESWPEDVTFGQQLDIMFGPGAPPLEWDKRAQYLRGAEGGAEAA